MREVFALYGPVIEQLSLLGEIYGRLLQLAQEKEPVLQANKDLGAVRGFTEREEALMAEAVRAERLRMEAVGRIAQALGREAHSLNVSELAGYAQPEEASKLLEAAGELMGVLQKLRAQNDINRQLLEMNLSFAAFVLEGAAQEESLGSAYGASGAPVESEPGSFRLLDSEI